MKSPAVKLMEAGLAAAEHVWATGQSFLQEPVGPHNGEIGVGVVDDVHTEVAF